MLEREKNNVSEWLVTDRSGGFAMGTPEGFRTRKYHGFVNLISGRGARSLLADLEFSLQGEALWPHRYAPGVLDHVEAAAECGRNFELGPDGAPVWSWKQGNGVLRFSCQSKVRGVITLSWDWQSDDEAVAPLLIRPFFAFRDLHGLGGRAWELRPEKGSVAVHAAGEDAARCRLRIEAKRRSTQRNLRWIERPYWYRQFYYSEEAERGYPAQEDLFSAGYWEIALRGRVEIRISTEEKTLRLRKPSPSGGGVNDFVLEEPAGVCAGFPWFGEWGRDTFIALPGIVAARLAGGESEKAVYQWAESALARWERWIRSDGMIPNVLEGEEGTPQWDSCDGTLWWAHSLAAIWAMYLDRPEWAERLRRRFAESLALAIQAVLNGRHRYLQLEPDGALAVTAASPSQAYSTWMDARVDGVAVTPRLGRLPEINALWFQERCLQSLWKSSSAEALGSDALERLAEISMNCEEKDRPNEVFLFSLPLAPAFFLEASRGAIGSAPRAQEIAGGLARLWSECGLRTLAPEAQGFKAQCQGTQAERDRAYHQGTIWPWLGAHFEMATGRGLRAPGVVSRGFSGMQPIRGHVPEIYDATLPHLWRGTPAQAWSLACYEEWKDRVRRGLDARLRELLVELRERRTA